MKRTYTGTLHTNHLELVYIPYIDYIE